MAELHEPVTADNDPSTVLGCTGCGWQPDFSRRDWRPSAVQFIAQHAYLNPDQRTTMQQQRPHPEAEDLDLDVEDEEKIEEQNKIAWDLIVLVVTLVVGVILIEVIWW